MIYRKILQLVFCFYLYLIFYTYIVKFDVDKECWSFWFFMRTNAFVSVFFCPKEQRNSGGCRAPTPSALCETRKRKPVQEPCEAPPCRQSRYTPTGGRNPAAPSSSSAGRSALCSVRFLNKASGRSILDVRRRVQGEQDRFRGGHGGSVQVSEPHPWIQKYPFFPSLVNVLMLIPDFGPLFGQHCCNCFTYVSNWVSIMCTTTIGGMCLCSFQY